MLCDIAGEQGHAVIGNLFGLDDDAQFTACLNCIGTLYTGRGVRDFLKLLQTLDIVFQIFTPRPRTRCRDGICCLYQASLNRRGLYIAVMCSDGVNYRLGFLVTLGDNASIS